jgi:hypothetical protein
LLFADVDLTTVQIVAGAVFTGAAAVIAVAATGTKDVVAAWFRRWTRAVEAGGDVHLAGVRKNVEFRKCCEGIQKLEFVDRVLIFQGTNCGGIPAPPRAYVVECLDGWATAPGDAPREKYGFPIKVDTAYMQMVAEIIDKGEVEVRTETMPDCQLRGYYESDGVNTARLYRLSVDATRLYYVSVASLTRPFTPKEVRDIRHQIEHLRSVM